MEWNSEVDELKKLIQLAKNRRKRGLPTPIIDNKPELNGTELYYYRAFIELCGKRQFNFGPQPIQLSEIAAWLDLQRITNSESRLEYALFIGLLDQTWLKWQIERSQNGVRKTGN